MRQPPTSTMKTNRHDSAGNEPLMAEEGYSVMEVTVALALFISVLVPAIGGALHVMTRGSVQEDVEALAHGQRLMEEALHKRQFEDREWLSQNGRWVFRRQVERKEDRVTLTIRVWRARGSSEIERATKTQPLFRAVTTRILPETDQRGEEATGPAGGTS